VYRLLEAEVVAVVALEEVRLGYQQALSIRRSPTRLSLLLVAVVVPASTYLTLLARGFSSSHQGAMLPLALAQVYLVSV